MLQNKAICGTTLSTESDLVLYSLVTQPGNLISGGDGTCSQTEEPYPGLESEVEQQIIKAGALKTGSEGRTSEFIPRLLAILHFQRF